MENFINTLNGIIWSPALVYLCLGAGLFYSIMTRFVQIRMIREMVNLMFSKTKSADGISSFQAFVIALANRVGVGNIAGVAAAIGFGGPSAVFWMWVVAFLGASTAYAESTLAQIYKERDPITGQYRGGPAYYFEKGLGQKWYAILFAIAAIISCGIFLPGVQANGVVSAVTRITGDGAMMNFAGIDVGTNRVIVMAVVVALLAVIIIGGIKRIARVAELVVPFMALGYIILSLIIMVTNLDKIPAVFGLIMSDILNPMAGLGAAIGWGVKRGVYSNEAGQGTGPHHAGAAEVQHPAQQGLVQAFSVYVDTLLVCSATAFMILTMGTYNIQNETTKEFIVQNVDPSIAEIGTPAFTQMALETTFGSFGNHFIAVAIFFFAFTTILAYYYIAEVNVAYLTRRMKASTQKLGVWIPKISVLLVVAYGSLNSAGYIWNMGDIGVGMTAWLNIVGILLMFAFLTKPTLNALRDYEEQKKAGVTNYTFDPVKLGIKGATFWEDRLKNK
ncbi:sodium:alanine symporter [Moraxella bovoculi]|uniref:alanine/glycine:cation symporter family protein n=1 Tax=Moraxella bovoculi TaxID=386891 RepID=UPI00062444EE|nr:alanine/glycine:cation symporter family protein [Moraxella bovoculi]AKG15552.2 sodium:alanine symporter [Moraxella bovoculi]AKG19020.1 sodium:alanine symporter [Moraxella bovoculi]NSM10414.1 alanine:cation symporter family protein [Moraxella bovoculi]